MDDLHTWLDALCAELGVDPADVDASAVLDLARDAAHQVLRPAAPLSAFVAGYAAGRAVEAAVAAGQVDGGPAGSAARAALAADPVERASALAVAWPDRDDTTGRSG